MCVCVCYCLSRDWNPATLDVKSKFLSNQPHHSHSVSVMHGIATRSLCSQDLHHNDPYRQVLRHLLLLFSSSSSPLLLLLSLLLFLSCTATACLFADLKTKQKQKQQQQQQQQKRRSKTTFFTVFVVSACVLGCRLTY